MAEAKVIQMEFDLFEVSKWNNFNPKEFITFLAKNNRGIIKMPESVLPVFKIEAKDVKIAIESYKKNKN